LLKSIVFIVLALFLASGIFTNYAGHDSFNTKKAGFFSGIIHGVISPIMLVTAIFTDFTMYELNNSGWWYNLGFLLGILITWGGSPNGSVIKNYYTPPKKEDNNLSNEDHDKIGKLIEEKINKLSLNKKNKRVSKKIKK